MASIAGVSTGPLGYGGLDPVVNPPFIAAYRAPTVNDQQNAGSLWQDNSQSPPIQYITTGAGVWTVLGAAVGTLDTLTASTGGPLTPVANNLNIFGTVDQITTAGSGATITLTIPATFIAPGSIASTSTITAATGLTVTSGGATITAGGLTVTAGGAAITGTTNINITGAAVTTIGTGGTGAVHIGNATGNTAVTGSLTASTGLVATTGGLTVSAGGASITGTTNINITGAAVTTIGTGGTGAVHIGNATGNTAVTGSLTASTGLVATTGGVTATAGNLVATAGNLNLNGAASKININVATGASASAGIGTLTDGVLTVSTTAATANSLVFPVYIVPEASPGTLSATAVGGTVTITSTDLTDSTSTVQWFLIN